MCSVERLSTSADQDRGLYFALGKLKSGGCIFLADPSDARDNAAGAGLELQIAGLHIDHHAIVHSSKLDMDKGG